MNDKELDLILEKISLSFGNETLIINIPEDAAIQLSMFKIGNIDTNNLDGESIRQSKLFSLFSSLLSYVSDRHSRSEALVKRLEAQLALQYEKQLIDSNERVSDKKIEKLVDADEGYLSAVNQKLDYKNMVFSFQNVLESLEHKRDMLLQLIIKRRQEDAQRQVPLI